MTCQYVSSEIWPISLRGAGKESQKPNKNFFFFYKTTYLAWFQTVLKIPTYYLLIGTISESLPPYATYMQVFRITL